MTPPPRAEVVAVEGEAADPPGEGVGPHMATTVEGAEEAGPGMVRPQVAEGVTVGGLMEEGAGIGVEAGQVQAVGEDMGMCLVSRGLMDMVGIRDIRYV